MSSILADWVLHAYKTEEDPETKEFRLGAKDSRFGRGDGLRVFSGLMIPRRGSIFRLGNMRIRVRSWTRLSTMIMNVSGMN